MSWMSGVRNWFKQSRDAIAQQVVAGLVLAGLLALAGLTALFSSRAQNWFGWFLGSSETPNLVLVATGVLVVIGLLLSRRLRDDSTGAHLRRRQAAGEFAESFLSFANNLNGLLEDRRAEPGRDFDPQENDLYRSKRARAREALARVDPLLTAFIERFPYHDLRPRLYEDQAFEFPPLYPFTSMLEPPTLEAGLARWANAEDDALRLHVLDLHDVLHGFVTWVTELPPHEAEMGHNDE